jgi:hypothetical protein
MRAGASVVRKIAYKVVAYLGEFSLSRTATSFAFFSFNRNSTNASVGILVIRRLLASFFILTGLSLQCSAADLLAPVLMADQSDFAPISMAPTPLPNSLFIFGGQFTTDNMVHSLNPFTANHERNYLAGGAYERDLKVGKYGTILGVEIGIADRFGMGESAELWGGLNIRHKGVVIFNVVRITPGVAVGFSAITNPVGTEAQRQSDHNGNAHFLGYLGPELAVAFQRVPNLEFIYRLQHRSGVAGIFGIMHEGSNANVFGARYHF